MRPGTIMVSYYYRLHIFLGRLARRRWAFVCYPTTSTTVSLLIGGVRSRPAVPGRVGGDSLQEDVAPGAEPWEGYVDWRNRPATRSRHGGMAAASFVLGKRSITACLPASIHLGYSSSGKLELRCVGCGRCPAGSRRPAGWDWGWGRGKGSAARAKAARRTDRIGHWWCGCPIHARRRSLLVPRLASFWWPAQRNAEQKN